MAETPKCARDDWIWIWNRKLQNV